MEIQLHHVYSVAMVRPMMRLRYDEPPPPTLREIVADRVRHGLSLGLMGLAGAFAVTVAPVQTITAFGIAFAIGLASRR